MVKLLFIALFTIIIINGQAVQGRHGNEMVNIDPFTKVKHGAFVFNCRLAGMDNDGEAVILLHGFPETSHMWNDLLPLLSGGGHKIIAPDQRGYSPGARPGKVRDYSIKRIAEDVFAIANAFDIDRFHLVGHDWGSVIGWAVIALEPERVISWTAMSVPHMKAFEHAYKKDKDQQKRSEYIGLFKLPFIPELYFSWNGYSRLRSLWKESSEEQKEQYLDIFKQRGALKASLNWYRANIGVRVEPEDQIRFGSVTVPSQLIWGNRDMALGRTGAELTKNYMKGPYRLVELDAGHWLIQESFQEVSSAIIEHIEKYSN
ncbi:uncharacterized protein METZ01_LOCUS58227 [marine metagenome]|uniref:AB hydrolase-1 domain-containing protein n=1 Tax=marine metagenome TaxID=408172 RepID=A0A381SVM0_9ZZZZ